MSSVDWGKFDQLIAHGNGPWRQTFAETINLGEPMPTGVAFLDETLKGGLHRGVLNVVAGFAHHGKTLLARTIAHHNRDKRILWLAADEGKRDVVWHLAGSILGMRSFELQHRARDPESDISATSLEKVLVDNYPNLHISSDLLGATPEDVASMVDQAERMWDAPADLIIFDYMGCLSVEGGDSNTLGLVHTRAHKQLCREFSDSVWLCMSQLNRPPSSGKQKAPELTRMFGGGEAAIDGCAIGVWRWPAEELSSWDTDVMLNVMKAKQGLTAGGGPATKKDADGTAKYKNRHIHTITAGSLIITPPREVVHDFEWANDDD